ATLTLVVSGGAGHGAGRMTPAEIQSTFFTGQVFTAATPSNVKFKMTFSTDGKVTREPVGTAGAKGQGTWKLSKEGFCTKWQGGQSNFFSGLPSGGNQSAILKSTAVLGIWAKYATPECLT